MEAVDNGDEQYPMESRFVVRHTPPDREDPVSTVGGPIEVCFLHFVVCQTPPDEHDPVSTVASQTQGRFLRFAVRQTPPDQQDPVSNVGGLFPPLCGTPGLVSIASSVQALLMNTTTHSIPTHEHNDDDVTPF